MACEYCHGEGWHHTRCPNYKIPKGDYYCSICGEWMYEGDEYIENNDGEYAHWDCIGYDRELLEWLGFEIKTMERTD